MEKKREKEEGVGGWSEEGRMMRWTSKEEKETEVQEGKEKARGGEARRKRSKSQIKRRRWNGRAEEEEWE